MFQRRRSFIAASTLPATDGPSGGPCLEVDEPLRASAAAKHLPQPRHRERRWGGNLALFPGPRHAEGREGHQALPAEPQLDAPQIDDLNQHQRLPPAAEAQPEEGHVVAAQGDVEVDGGGGRGLVLDVQLQRRRPLRLEPGGDLSSR